MDLVIVLVYFQNQNSFAPLARVEAGDAKRLHPPQLDVVAWIKTCFLWFGSDAMIVRSSGQDHTARGPRLACEPYLEFSLRSARLAGLLHGFHGKFFGSKGSRRWPSQVLRDFSMILWALPGPLHERYVPPRPGYASSTVVGWGPRGFFMLAGLLNAVKWDDLLEMQTSMHLPLWLSRSPPVALTRCLNCRSCLLWLYFDYFWSNCLIVCNREVQSQAHVRCINIKYVNTTAHNRHNMYIQYMCETCNLYLCSSVSPCDAECWTRKSCAVIGAPWHAVIHMYFCMPGLSHTTTDSSRFQQSDSDFHNEKWWKMWVSFECHKYFGNLWNLPTNENEGSEVTVKYILPSPVRFRQLSTVQQRRHNNEKLISCFGSGMHITVLTLGPHHSVCMCIFHESNSGNPTTLDHIPRGKLSVIASVGSCWWTKFARVQVGWDGPSLMAAHSATFLAGMEWKELHYI